MEVQDVNMTPNNGRPAHNISFTNGEKRKNPSLHSLDSDSFSVKKQKTESFALPQSLSQAAENQSIPKLHDVSSDETGNHTNRNANEREKFKIAEQLDGCYREVDQRNNVRWAQHLQSSLIESRDRVLELAKQKKLDTKTNSRVVCQFPTNACKTFPVLTFCSPCSDESSNDKEIISNSDSSNTDAPKSESSEATETKIHTEELTNGMRRDTRTITKHIDRGITVKCRNKKGSQFSQNLTPSLVLEGTHKSRPPHSATVFLRSHFFSEDEQQLTYVPYFGDDDKEDVVSDVFDIYKREEMIKTGPEYRRKRVDKMIDDVIHLLMSKNEKFKNLLEVNGKDGSNGDKWKNNTLLSHTYKSLAKLMNVDSDRIHERHRACLSMASTGNPNRNKSPTTRSKETEGEESDVSDVKNSSTKKMLCYEDLMDSYRGLFCRRCFTYDCNFHGNLEKPDVELQGELAVQKELDGHWEDIENAIEFDDTSTTDNGNISVVSNKPQSDETQHNTPKDHLELDAFQKSVCKRAFLIFQGDTAKISKAIGASHDVVKQFVKEKSYELSPPIHIQEYLNQKVRKSKSKKKDMSMRNYNQTWLKRVEGAEIHPAFQPCNHTGVCSEDNCSCVKNAFFCTKHCVWGSKSKNFFRGCACKGNQCRTKSCSCFAARRECDPDLCRNCGACSDPPNAPAVKQMCRNDNIGMRRHCHLLLAESSVENAGWGIYTKHALKKGDYVHEYIGEVISQEEAERRGRVYDKVNRSYLFNLSSDYVVDASRKGNKTKFANHSSKPNCYTKMVNVNGDIRIGLFAQEDIEPQSELFFDYRYNVGMDNDLILKPGKTVDWMKNPKMANQIRKKTT